MAAPQGESTCFASALAPLGRAKLKDSRMLPLMVPVVTSWTTPLATVTATFTAVLSAETAGAMIFFATNLKKRPRNLRSTLRRCRAARRVTRASTSSSRPLGTGSAFVSHTICTCHSYHLSPLSGRHDHQQKARRSRELRPGPGRSTLQHKQLGDRTWYRQEHGRR